MKIIYEDTVGQKTTWQTTTKVDGQRTEGLRRIGVGLPRKWKIVAQDKRAWRGMHYRGLCLNCGQGEISPNCGHMNIL